jgi:UDP-glucose 4-epimerase
MDKRMGDIGKKKVLVTGSTGFVGSHVVREFIGLGYEVIGISRSETSNLHRVKNISGNTDWSDVLEGVEIIIHCAAAVHKMKSSQNTLHSYQTLNVDGTLNLAEQAKNSVKRFIFLSSVKVNGEETFSDKFFADDIANPIDPYGVSKACAETGLRKIGVSSKMEIVIIRPPLVYGPNPKGNLEMLAKHLKRRIPLPLGSVTSNSRSLVYVGNLVDFISICAEHPLAVNETFLISDDSDLSTASMIRHIGTALQLQPLLLPVPVFILNFFFKALGKREFGMRLLGNLCVDVTKNKTLLDWKPKYSSKEGFQLSFKN